MVEKIEGCETVWREISNYVDGEVDGALRSTMDEHFRTCLGCAAVLAGIRNVVQLYGDERMLLDVPAGFSRRLEKRLARSASSIGSRWSSWSTWLVPVAAMALFAVGLQVADNSAFKNPPKSLLAEPAHGIPPDMKVVVTDGSRLFHVPGCEFIHDKATERTLTAKEAMQDGYMPCPRCMRQYLKISLIGQPGADATSAEAEEEGEETLSVVGH